MMTISAHTKQLIKDAIKEDIEGGDITTNALIGADDQSIALIVAKESLVLSGSAVFEAVFKDLDPTVSFTFFFKDGQQVKRKEEIVKIVGPTQALLSGERTALNFLQRLSGIATLTARYKEKVSGYDICVLDTRKTIPGYRELEKYAVSCGGGENHRIGLFDMVMIKDNHIEAAGGITKSVEIIRKIVPSGILVEVEVKNLEELKEALCCDIDIVLLDNMSLPDMKKAVEITRKKFLLEASGGITLNTIQQVAETGVDRISIGALTHSARGVDISMKIVTA